jgi:hypothetical protein
LPILEQFACYQTSEFWLLASGFLLSLLRFEVQAGASGFRSGGRLGR